ncbi:MAG TPA: hypothetical protein VD866_28305 [Urbifossiella sp.]|nr:hypothetical protein [Urbifossiella sp.]
MIPRGWRRDLLSAVVGGMVTAGALVPAGWIRLSRAEAEAEYARAELAAAKAEAAAWQELK